MTRQNRKKKVSAKKRKKVSRKPRCEVHKWRPYTWTFTSWHDIGPAYQIHRSCERCSLIDWDETCPAINDSPEGRDTVSRLIKAKNEAC